MRASALLHGRRDRLQGADCGLLRLLRAGGSAAGLLRLLVKLLQVCAWIFRIDRRGLVETRPQSGELAVGRRGDAAGLLQFVGAPHLAQDGAAVARVILHQELGEAALGQHRGTQEGVAVEPDHLLDALVHRARLLHHLQQRAVGGEAAQLRGLRAYRTTGAAAQGARHFPIFIRGAKTQHDAQLAGGVVHQLPVQPGEGGLPIQGIGHRFDDRGFARSRVADDGDLVAPAQVESDRGAERAQPFDGQFQRPHAQLRGGAAPSALSTWCARVCS